MVPPLTGGIPGPFFGSVAPFSKLALRAQTVENGRFTDAALAKRAPRAFPKGSLGDHLPADGVIV